MRVQLFTSEMIFFIIITLGSFETYLAMRTALPEPVCCEHCSSLWSICHGTHQILKVIGGGGEKMPVPENRGEGVGAMCHLR